MLELYFNGGNFLPESREEEQSAETVLNIMLAGKTTDTEMCIWPCFYHAPMCKGVLINLDDGTTLRIKPFLNKEGEPELLTGHDLTAYEDHIRSALVKYRMPEEAARGIMHWYDELDSLNDKVRSVTFDVERRDGKLWGIAECQISGELSAAELTTLKEYIEGQASDGWGEGFEQHEIAIGRGSELYVHLWQDEDWSIQTEQERFRAHFDKLPEMCFTLLPGTGQLICIKRGESGYYPSDWSTGDAHENRRIADEQNRKRGVTPAQEEAMKIGSMCGWDVPGADPDNCEDIVQRRGGMKLG